MKCSFGGFSLVLPVLVLVAAACDDEVGPEVAERYVATLDGASVLPTPVTTTATGTAEFTLLNGLPGLHFRLDVAGIDNVTLAHIHGPFSATTPTAGVIVDLYLGPTTGTGVTGTLAEGVASAAKGMTIDSLLVLLRNGSAYVNVHNSANPAGHIRGNIARQ